MTEPLVGTVEAIRPRKVNGAAGQIRPKGTRATLTAIRGTGKELFVDYNDVRITFTYNRDALSNRDWRLITADVDTAKEDPTKVQWVVTALSRLLVGWDLYSDENARQPLPINTDTLDELPFGLLAAISNRIFEDINPNSEATDSGSFA